MNMYRIPEIDKWAINYWIWHGRRFETLKQAKAYIDDAYGRELRKLLDDYDSIGYIAHYDRNGVITSIVEIVPDEKSKHRYHYTKSQRVYFNEAWNRIAYAWEF